MADPDLEWMEGFERWGSENASSGQYGFFAYMDDGEYTSIAGDGTLVDGLVPSAGGLAFRGSAGLNNSFNKTLGANFARVIGGACMEMFLASSNTGEFARYHDGGTNQMGVGWNTSGQLYVARNGTILATSVETFANGSINFVAWDITFHNSTGIYKVWLNGVLTTLNASGVDTCGSANNYCNALTMACNRANALDHFWHWFYTAAGGSELPALDNPVIETSTVDETVASQFSLGLGAAVGHEYLNGGSRQLANTTTAYRPFIAAASGNVTKIFIYPNGTFATNKFKVSLYDDNGAGRPNNRLCAPVEVTGFATGTVISLTIASTAVVKGTKYHIAISCDRGSGSTILLDQVSDTTQGWTTTEANYEATHPATAGTATAANPPFVWCDVTAVASADFYSQLAFAHPGPYNYLASSTVNHRDEFGFPDLSINPTNIYSVSVSYAVSKSDAGVKTLDLEVDSGGVKYTGSNGSGKTPPQTMNWYTSYYRKNPNGSVNWTKAAVDAMHAGYKITA